MGIAVQVWRARIGCFTARYIKCRGEIENSGPISIGVLNCKNLFGTARLLLFVTFLLLLVSGDIETNPGPVDICSQFPLKGNFHQGSALFSPQTRGKQCLPCCISFFLRVELKTMNMTLWTIQDVDCVLHDGDYIYRTVVSHLPIVQPYLHPSELPQIIKLESKYFSLKLTKSFSGNISKSFIGQYPLVNLETAITLGLSPEKYAIFICKENACAIFRQENYFYVFDSHSRDTNGYCTADGTSILLKYSTFNGLCQYMRCLVQSLSSNETDHNNLNYQFDLHMFSLQSVKETTVQRYRKTDKFVCIVPQTHDLTSSFEHSNISEKGIKRKKTFDSCKETKKIKKNKKDIISFFHQLVSKGPEYICTSCSQLFFKHSVRKYSNLISGMSDALKRTCITGIKSSDGVEWLCSQCYEYFRKNKVPPCSIGNGLKFHDVPNELAGLTELEERLIAPRIPFMQIRELPRGGQHCIKGNIVNVPSDVNNTIKLLPRNMDESETIPLKLKRSKSFNSYILYEQIRPHKIVIGIRWLIERSLLFRNEGIQVNEGWINQIVHQFRSERENASTHENNSISSQFNEGHSSSDGWTETDERREHPGNLDTVMQAADFREFNRILTVAPAEGNVPLGMFQDKNAEFLAFPKIYCGQTRDSDERKILLHYSTICKWELRNIDRRCAQNVTNIFFKLKKLQIKQIADKVSLAIRKCKLKGKKMTASDMLSKEHVDKILKLDEGYKVLRTLRGSPPYWEQAKKDIFAMIKQLGVPTWFCSFSAAETKWLSLLHTLGSVVHGKNYTDDELINLSWNEKCELIKSDPVTCARYFDYRVHMFLLNVLKSDEQPIGKIKDFFYRVEFQQRGSPHIHMLVWIEDAPHFGIQSHEEVVSFIDQHITCKKDETMKELINYQTHRHARTCRKKGKAVCRFGFPLPPMTRTMILNALESNDERKIKAEKNHCLIMSELEKLKLTQSSMSFMDFLKKLGLTEEEYITALRSSIKSGRSKLFLKRNICDIRVNSYNTILLNCWEANLDIQYILDPFACAAYIVSYISKGQRGMSKLLSDACKEARTNASDIKQQVRRVGNTFLSHVEIGAQEAVYLILQMPLRRASRKVTFINTNPPDNRVSLIKPISVLKELPKTSTSVEADNDLKRYQRRPGTMERYCLADYIAWFDVIYPSSKQKTASASCVEDELLEDTYEIDTVDNPVTNESEIHGDGTKLPIIETTTDLNEPQSKEEHFTRDGSVLRRRKRSKVLYSVGFSIDHDRENHFRELIMLYLPWRDELKLIDNFSSYEEKYDFYKTTIETKKQQYISMSSSEIANLDNEILNVSSENNALVVPEEQQQNELDQLEGCTDSQIYKCFDPGRPQSNTNYDLGLDIGVGRNPVLVDEQIQGEMFDNEYRKLVQSLNKKQKEFFYHVLSWHKIKKEPLYNFLTGGAGVGKSVLLKAIFQSLNKYYSHKVGENPDSLHILICAPTGKAAYNVGGMTVHSAFNIPANQSFDFKPLDMQQLGSFQSKFKSLKVIFIDEISMVGHRMFNFINLRLQEIMGTTKPFGGISLIAFGDLYQLKPVKDGWIFASVNNGENLDALATNLWKEYFTIFELDQIMRQKDDHMFAELLNRLREGNYLQEDIDILKSKVVDKNEQIMHIPHLYTKRSKVEKHNTKVFNQSCAAKKCIIPALDSVSGTFSQEMKIKILSKIPDDATKTKGLVKQLHVAEDLPAELCSNIDVSDGMANGTPCTIKKLDFRVSDSDRCSIIWVQFDEENIGRKCRHVFRHLFTNIISPCWTPVIEVTKKFAFNYYRSFYITRRQFPITLASAKTVHKAQGSTMSKAAIHFGKKKIDHIHYVALSRVRNLSSVKILKMNENKISISPVVSDEMDRMRNNARTALAIPLLYDFPSTSRTVVYHNCRSLHKHIDDIKNEMNLLAADVLAFSETRLNRNMPSENYELPAFTLFRNDSSVDVETGLAYHGTAIYMQQLPTDFQILNACNIEITYTRVSFLKIDIQLIIVYCAPKKATIANLKEIFMYLSRQLDFQKPVIIMGDFNVDAGSNHQFISFVESKYRLKQLISTQSTDYDTVIDHIYTNLEKDCILSFGTLESYFSDHKPVYITINS